MKTAAITAVLATALAVACDGEYPQAVANELNPADPWNVTSEPSSSETASEPSSRETSPSDPWLVAPPPAPFNPITAEVSQDDDGIVEILAFDGEGDLIGALLVTADPEVGTRLDANFGDGYASALVISADSSLSMGGAPEPGMLSQDELQQRCVGEPGSDSSVTSWWDTNFADPCEALRRVEVMLVVAREPLMELGADPLADKPSRRECIWRFAMSGSLCAATVLLPALAGGCAYNTVVNLCACAKHLGVKEFCSWD